MRRSEQSEFTMNTEDSISWIDVDKVRRVRNYSRSEQSGRIIWSILAIAFRLTPRPLFGLRANILRMLGAKIGSRVHIYPTAKIFFPWNLEVGDDSAIGENAFIYNLGKISIGSRVTISHNTQLCGGTHNYREASFPLIRATITVADEAWICTQALICPFVTVGRGAIVGAGAVVTKDVPEAAIMAGNPAKQISTRPATR